MSIQGYNRGGHCVCNGYVTNINVYCIIMMDIVCCLSLHKGGGVDYVWTASPAVLTLTFDSTNLLQLQCVNITIIDDVLVEIEEIFSVALSLQSNPRQQVMLQTSSASISILDNDGRLISFQSIVCASSMRVT